jgi:hypothetical protein
LRERERNITQNSINKQALEEEIKQAAAMKSEVIEERRRLEEEVTTVHTIYVNSLVLVMKDFMGDVGIL